MKKIFTFFVLLILCCTFVGCSTPSVDSNESEVESDQTSESVSQESSQIQSLFDESGYFRTFYVSPLGSDDNKGSFDKPFATIEKAQSVVRQINKYMSGDIAIVLMGGEYVGEVNLTENDGGSNGYSVVYTKYPNDDVLLSGGKRIEKWVKDESGLYYSYVNVQGVRNLFINGKRSTLARNPNGVQTTKLASWSGSELIANTEDLMGAESFEICTYNEWAQSVIKVIGVKDGVLQIGQKESKYLVDLHDFQKGVEKAVYYCNAFEFLDSPGEFYFDSSLKKLWYYPVEGEDPNDYECVVPCVDGLFNIKGSSPINKVTGVTIKDLAFKYSDFSYMNQNSFCEVQTGLFAKEIENNVLLGDVAPATINVQNADGITIEGVKISKSSGIGVCLLSSVENCNIVGCLIEDISSSAIMISPNVTAVVDGRLDLDEQLSCGNVNVCDNYIKNTGVEFAGSASIANVWGHNVTIAHNEISYGSYTGISNGWGWSNADKVCKNNKITYNDIHHIGLNGSDLAGIYNLNKQEGTVISYNYIHEIGVRNKNAKWQYSPHCALYLDEGSEAITVRSNQIYHAYEDISSDSYENLVYKNNAGVNDIANNKGFLAGDVLDKDIIDACGVRKDKNAFYTGDDYLVTGESVLSFSVAGETESLDGFFGFTFTTTTSVTIKGLGRLQGINNRMRHTLYLLDDSGEVLAICVADSLQNPAKDNYVYGLFQSPIALEEGKTYNVVSREYAFEKFYSSSSQIAFSEYFTVNNSVCGSKIDELSIGEQSNALCLINFLIGE